jgi:perosamine synthetase
MPPMSLMKDRVRNALLAPDRSLHDALKVINESDVQIALIVSETGRLLGTVTDGDIRRAILRGVGLDQPVSGIMNRKPMTVSPRADTQEIRRIFIESKLKHVPVVDDTGRLLDILLVNDLLVIPLSNPDITDSERKAVLDVLNTTHLSLGPKVVEFEEKIAALAGRRYAVAVNSGTSGLHLVVKALGLGPGDEVITTPFSFIASSNCLLYEGVTPVFVDIEPDTYNIDPECLEAAITPRTKAILPVDVFGQPARYDAIEAVAGRHGLKIISDCCESIGSEYLGRKSGSFGAAGVFAFYPNKQITTGEGGAIVTDDAEVAAMCRSLRNQGRGEGGGWLAHERLGYNYRLSDISAALGTAQVERIGEIIDKRQVVASVYQELLGSVEEISIPFIAKEVTRMSWFVYVVRLAERFTREDRDFVIQQLSQLGIGANSYFQPIHLQPFYVKKFGFKEGDFPITERIGQRTIALPFHNHLTPETAANVVRNLTDALAKMPSRGKTDAPR